MYSNYLVLVVDEREYLYSVSNNAHLIATGGCIDDTDFVALGRLEFGLVEVGYLRDLVLERGLERPAGDGRVESAYEVGEGPVSRRHVIGANRKLDREAHVDACSEEGAEAARQSVSRDDIRHVCALGQGHLFTNFV